MPRLLAIWLAAAAARADSVAVFNEIHYHPANRGSEWVEIRNTLAVDLKLSARGGGAAGKGGDEGRAEAQCHGGLVVVVNDGRPWRGDRHGG